MEWQNARFRPIKTGPIYISLRGKIRAALFQKQKIVILRGDPLHGCQSAGHRDAEGSGTGIATTV